MVERPVPSQPVAYIGGRYVYGHADSMERSADARRTEVRHRAPRVANIR